MTGGHLGAAGLSLAGARAAIGDGAAGEQLAAAVAEMDRAIVFIRDTVFPDGNRVRP